jgi:large subunit ribosomal protein L4
LDENPSWNRRGIVETTAASGGRRSCRFLSSGAPASGPTRTAKNSGAAGLRRRTTVPIPPNLHIDPRSSFVVSAAADRGAARDNDGGGGREEKKGAAGREDDDDGDEEDDGDGAVAAVLEREVEYVVPLPDRLRVSVHDLADRSEVGTLWLEPTVFGRDPVRIDLLKRAVDYHRAKKRGRRTAVTKTIGEVSGSGRKIRQQKGTGRARVGHNRPPHFRGGAKAHGPKNVTDYGNTKLNKKVRKQALCHALSQKLKEGNLILLNNLEVPSHKTKELSTIFQQWNVGGTGGSSALVLDHYFPPEEEEEKDGSGGAPSYRGVPANLYVASRNIGRVTVGNSHKANVYELLRNEKLVLTLEALSVLERRLKNY